MARTRGSGFLDATMLMLTSLFCVRQNNLPLPAPLPAPDSESVDPFTAAVGPTRYARIIREIALDKRRGKYDSERAAFPLIVAAPNVRSKCEHPRLCVISDQDA